MLEKATGNWVKEHNKYPKCSVCGYYWIETTVGKIGSGESNIKDANYCPKCGTKMLGIISK